MTTTGKIKDLARNVAGETLITLRVDAAPEIVEQLLHEEELDVEIKKHRKKRSLNANSYYYLLCGKIAKKLGTSMTEVCNSMIADYGEIDRDMGCIILREDINWKMLEVMHLRPTGKTQVMADRKRYSCYFVMRGSHTYDTKEMSVLIDGVVSEAQALGIETMTPAQLATVKNAWNGPEDIF